MITRTNLLVVGVFSSVIWCLLHLDKTRQRVQRQKQAEDTAAVDEPLEMIYRRPPEQREKIFYALLLRGNELVKHGDGRVDETARLFYKAVKMVPNPQYLLNSLRTALPPLFFQALTDLIARETARKTHEYFGTLVPVGAPVDFRPRALCPTGSGIEHVWGMYSTGTIGAGQTIYEEDPDVSVLDPCLASADHCSHCLMHLQGAKSSCDGCGQPYCSEACQAAEAPSHYLLCGNPAMERLAEQCRSHRSVYSLLAAKYLAILLAEESRSLDGVGDAQAVFPHYEFLVMMNLPVLPSDSREADLVREALARSGLAGLDQFLTDQRYMSVKGALIYNGIGLDLGLRLPRRPGTESARFSGDACRMNGVGLYHVSAHLQHSCDPTAEIQSKRGNHRISVVARRAIMPGEEITVAFAPPGDRSGVLRDRYSIVCACELCMHGRVNE